MKTCKECKYRGFKEQEFCPGLRVPHVSICMLIKRKVGKYIKENIIPDWCPKKEVE